MIKFEKPPNYDAICEAFPRAKLRHVIFAYFPHIYMPDGGSLDIAVRCHEEVHLQRQSFLGPEAWWNKYINDPAFRLDEEIVAHIAEADKLLEREGANRRNRKRIAAIVGLRLANPLYKYDIKVKAAEKVIYDAISDTSSRNHGARQAATD